MKENEVVLIQFRVKPSVELPAVIREEKTETDREREARRQKTGGTTMLLRNGVTPSGLLNMLASHGLTLVNARSQLRKGDTGKLRRLVTFTFGKNALEAPRRAELASAAAFLESQLQKRWGEAKAVRFQEKNSLEVILFAHEAERPQDPREVDDPEAASYGFVITKPRPKQKAA